MKLFIVALVAACGIAAVTASDPAWSDFRGSFLIGKDESFAQFPRTTSDALFSSEGWAPTSSIENDCTNGGKFNGIQYVKNNNYDVGLLYDNDGVIVGIQMLIAHEDVLSEQNTLRYDLVGMYNNATYNDKEYFVLTMYLVDPTNICSTGRTDSPIATEGTGTGLYIQTGPTPTSFMELPKNRPVDENARNSGWTQNNCFPAMGYHNFYRQNEYAGTNCTQMDPIFGLYNRQYKLHGFGFITPGNLSSPRFEHPPPTAIKLILGDTPKCVLDIQKEIGVSSLHVYMIPRPWFISCSIFRALSAYASGAAEWLSNFSG